MVRLYTRAHEAHSPHTPHYTYLVNTLFVLKGVRGEKEERIRRIRKKMERRGKKEEKQRRERENNLRKRPDSASNTRGMSAACRRTRHAYAALASLVSSKAGIASKGSSLSRVSYGHAICMLYLKKTNKMTRLKVGNPSEENRVLSPFDAQGSRYGSRPLGSLQLEPLLDRSPALPSNHHRHYQYH